MTIYRLNSDREPAQCYAADNVAAAHRNAYTLLFPGSRVRLVEHRGSGVVVEIVTSNQQNRPDDPPIWVQPPPGAWQISYLTWPLFEEVR